MHLYRGQIRTLPYEVENLFSLISALGGLLPCMLSLTQMLQLNLALLGRIGARELLQYAESV